MFINIPEITMDPVIAFTGTDEEIEKLENQEDICSAAWRKIIENPDFSALGFQSGTDYLVLSHSTDNNGIFRLTYFWNGESQTGKPTSWILPCTKIIPNWKKSFSSLQHSAMVNRSWRKSHKG